MTASHPRWFRAVEPMSGSVLVALGIVLAVETVAVHLWLSARWPILAWTLASISVLSGVWLFREYRGRTRLGVLTEEARWRVTLGSLGRVDVPLEHVQSVREIAWRDVPEPASAYHNAAAPNDPNVLLEFAEPLKVRLPLGLSRRVMRLGVRLVEPAAFVDWTTQRP